MNLEDYADAEELREALRRAHKQLGKANAKVEDLVNASYQGAYDAMLALGPLEPVQAPAQRPSRKASEVALLHITDWQGGKLTTTYNSDVMVTRVMKTLEKLEHLTNIQRTDHPVNDLTIALGGDMLEGLFNFPTQPFEIDSTLYQQYERVSRLLARTVRESMAMFQHVTVIGEWGNHGRIGNKRDTVPRHDNLDRMCYTLARAILGDDPRLTWEDSPEDIQRIEIGNYRALSIHGDEVGRSGYVSDSQMLNHINKWKSGSYPWEFSDVYVGHYHQHKELALPDGRGAVYFTGSTESDNRYALLGMAAAGVPTQRLHFIDPERGRVTAQYKIWLDD